MSRAATLLSTIARLLNRFMVPLVLIVFAVPFIILLFYSVPAADDFCNASLSFMAVPQHSVLSVTWLYYTKWSPRWVTTLLFLHATSHGDLLREYGWLLLSVIVINLVSLWYFFRSVLCLTRVNSLLAAGVFYAAWIASLTSPDQQLYWLTNVIVYNLPLSSLLVLVGLLLRPRRTLWYYIALVLLSIAVPAQHEIAGTFLCMIAFTGVVVVRVKKLARPQWYVSLGVATASLAAVMLSPGNAARAAAEHKHLWDIRHFPHWAGHSFYHGLNWLGYPAILIAACCILLLYQPDPDAGGELPPKWLGIASLCAIFLILCDCALVEVATSTWLPDRVAAWFQFVIWLLFVCAVATGVPDIAAAKSSLGLRIGVFTLLAITLLGSTSYRMALEDIRGPAQSWWRIDAARLAHHGGSLVFEAPAQFPKLAKPQMLTADPGCWVNQCMANYLQADSVIVNNSKDECPH